MAKYLCKNCHRWIELDWWEAHHGRCSHQDTYGWLIAILLVLFAFGTFVCSAEEVKEEKDWVKGGVVTAVKADGGCIFKPFIQVGIAEDNPDDDTAQILGYSPGNVQINKDGQPIWERVSESRFVPLNRWKIINGRMCKCPPYNNL